MESRLEIYLEQYCLSIGVEANLTLEMASTSIFPAAIRYQNELASAYANLKVLDYEFDTDTLVDNSAVSSARRRSAQVLTTPGAFAPQP